MMLQLQRPQTPTNNTDFWPFPAFKFKTAVRRFVQGSNSVFRVHLFEFIQGSDLVVHQCQQHAVRQFSVEVWRILAGEKSGQRQMRCYPAEREADVIERAGILAKRKYAQQSRCLRMQS